MDTTPRIVTLTLNPALDLSTATAHVEPVHKLRCEAPRFDPGGGGVNVARVTSRLGADTLAIFPVGGPTGERLTGLLAAEGLKTQALPIAGDTRESFSVTDRGDGGEYRFVLPGPELSEAEWTACLEATMAAAHPDGLVPEALVVVSGSLAPGGPPAALAELARRCRSAGLRLAVDTSGEALEAALSGGVFLIKPSLRELSDLSGRPRADEAARLKACRELIGRGAVQVIALSLGPEGAMLVTAQEALFAGALPVQPISTIGAGDSFLGGLLWALTRGMPLAECLRHAAAAGAAAVLSPGTALSHADDVRRLAADVDVQILTP
jgi:6-phosphofructokinase 2